MNKKHIHYFIAGKVQGVWYRDSAQKQAVKLGLTGWVRNLNDGRVEALACGDEKQLTKFEKWLWKGPVLAKVTDIVKEDVVSEEDYKDFRII